MDPRIETTTTTVWGRWDVIVVLQVRNESLLGGGATGPARSEEGARAKRPPQKKAAINILPDMKSLVGEGSGILKFYSL